MTLPLRLPSAIAGALLAAGLATGIAWAADPAPATVAPAAPIQPAPPVAPAAPAVVTPAAKPSVSTQVPMHQPTVRVAPASRPESKPSWSELNPQQQESLAPLAGTWRSLSEAHKRKWLALSRNYHTMPAPEQARLHSRMAEWANLSPQQRTIARMNYAATQAVPANDKKAKWEAYQALSPEEKRKLASRAAATKGGPPSTAVAVRPASSQKAAHAPKARKPENGAHLAVIPGQVDQNTLLPQPGTQPTKP